MWCGTLESAGAAVPQRDPFDPMCRRNGQRSWKILRGGSIGSLEQGVVQEGFLEEVVAGSSERRMEKQSSEESSNTQQRHMHVERHAWGPACMGSGPPECFRGFNPHHRHFLWGGE